mmetsp:Transcript_3820/g.5210  ORF Transcript_3820/g.5210 Transcript_3820/m.5210 type:complete len:106 (-) Transcript_3820:16-333(-)
MLRIFLLRKPTSSVDSRTNLGGKHTPYTNIETELLFCLFPSPSRRTLPLSFFHARRFCSMELFPCISMHSQMHSHYANDKTSHCQDCALRFAIGLAVIIMSENAT